MTQESKKVEKSLLNSERLFKKGIRNGAKKAGNSIVERSTKMLDSGSRTGRHYSGLPHRSSAPGEYPRSQSGRLKRSVYFKANGSNTLRIGATEKHALYLESGTRFMSARPNPANPWLRAAMKLEDRNVENYLQNGPYEELKC